MTSLSASSASPSSTSFRLERVELYELTLPLVEPFIISGGTMTHRRSLVVILHDERGNRGLGESPPFELPFYSDETLAGARHLLEQVLIPRLLQAQPGSSQAADRCLARWHSRKPLCPRGNRHGALGPRSGAAEYRTGSGSR